MGRCISKSHTHGGKLIHAFECELWFVSFLCGPNIRIVLIPNQRYEREWCRSIVHLTLEIMQCPFNSVFA